MRALVLIALVACTHPRRVAVPVPEMMRHLDALGREGRAQMDTVVVAGDATTPGARETVFVDQSVTLGDRDTTLTALLAGCGPFVATTPCELASRGGELIVLRTVEPPRSYASEPVAVTPTHKGANPATVTGVMSLVAFTGMTICLFECSSDKALKSGILGGTGVVLGVLWALLHDGARD